MNIDYNFCKKSELTANDLLIWLDLGDGFIDGYCDGEGVFNRYMQILSDFEIRISCPMPEFDKWSNSEEMYFDLAINSQRREFVNWVMNQRGIYEQ